MARNPHVQLLVHAGAPSANDDDVRYRAQASAYALQPPAWRRVQLELAPIDHQCPSANHPASDRTEQPSRSSRPEPTSSYIEDTQLAYAALDTQFLPLSSQKAEGNQLHHSSTDEQVGPSGPGRPRGTAGREHCDEKGLMICDGGISADNRTSSSSAENCLDETSNKRQDGAHSNDDSTSQLPSSFSLTESDRLDEAAQSAEAAARKDLDPRSSPLNGTPSAEVQESNDLVTECVHAIEPSPTSVHQPSVSDEHWPGDISSIIRAPSPPVSTSVMDTHITPTLQHLASESPAAGRYNPVSISRVIQPFERGHWLVDCGTWQRSTQVDFWKTLEALITNGSAGWGIWAHRGADVNLDDSHPAQAQVPQSSFGPIKVYCWGEVVEHTYLILYVASNSRVRRQGLQWIDSNGDVVVQMRAAGSSSAFVGRPE